LTTVLPLSGECTRRASPPWLDLLSTLVVEVLRWGGGKERKVGRRKRKE
jgi:hypothetical protein